MDRIINGNIIIHQVEGTHSIITTTVHIMFDNTEQNAALWNGITCGSRGAFLFSDGRLGLECEQLVVTPSVRPDFYLWA